MGTFDTALLAALLSAGIDADRAREVVDRFDRAIDERVGLHTQVLATKRDLAELQLQLSARIDRTNERIAESNERIAESNERIAGLEVRIAGTHERIAESRADLLRWMLGALTAQTALLLGAFKLL
jgi:septal ring factor EnvC (AmiA/AmiB activator)